MSETNAPALGKKEETIWPEETGLIEAISRNPTNRKLIILFSLLLIPLILWQTAVVSNQTALDRLAEQGSQRLTIYRSSLQSEFEKYEFQPILLSRMEDMVRLLIDPDDTAITQWMNHRLSEINEIAKTSATYLMDKNGITLAASNWKSDRSFVGNNFAFRPYFKQAIAGKSGRYFALGTTSNKPGYYLSHPIQAAGQTLGVVVVKVSVERLEKDWAASNDKVMVSDKDGIVFISSKPNWKYKSLTPLSETVREELKNSRKYSHAKLQPLSITKRKPYDDKGEIITLAEKDAKSGKIKSGSHFLQDMKIPGAGWTLHLISPMKPVYQTITYTVLIVTSGLIITVLIALYLIQKRLAARDRQNLQRQAQLALQEANDSLEQRVQERTRDLQRAQDGLIQASKLAALGQMAAGITHELNNPLAAIRSYSDNARVLIERERFGDAAENLSQISNLTSRMAEITQQLKTFSRKTEGRQQAISVNDAIDHALSLLSKSGSLNGVSINYTPLETPLTVKGNLVRLEQVFINLFSNAIDAMADSKDRILDISIVVNSTKAKILVHDSGPGLDEEIIEQVFDPFFTTKEVGKGLGLGLSISSRIISDFGGMMSAENDPEGGALFRVELLRE
ncbi:MAG: ATP-binding protein [Alphaproteobacteria bacterium]|nr:ATP-binding protein [Alphaproteobacteria bacterium]